MSTQNEELNNIRNNNIIVIVSTIIVIAWYISNKIQERDIIENNNHSTTVHYIRLGIYITSILIYLYFIYANYKNVRNQNKNQTKKQRLANNLNLLASTIFLVGGIIILYVEILNGQTDEEIGFF